MSAPCNGSPFYLSVFRFVLLRPREFRQGFGCFHRIPAAFFHLRSFPVSCRPKPVREKVCLYLAHCISSLFIYFIKSMSLHWENIPLYLSMYHTSLLSLLFALSTSNLVLSACACLSLFFVTFPLFTNYYNKKHRIPSKLKDSVFSVQCGERDLNPHRINSH